MVTKKMNVKTKILHLGNIANNAYLNTKFLIEKGINCTCISHDYDDLIATPEWEELPLSGAEITALFKKNKLSRPNWFLSGPLKLIGLKYDAFDNYDSYLLFKTKYNNSFLGKISWGCNKNWIKIIKRINPYFEFTSIEDYLYFRRLLRVYSIVFPERKDKLSIEDILPYLPQVRIFKKIFKSYDIVQAYGTEPIYPLLANKRPYVAFEHGTIRDLPFENSPYGRLTALAYRLADKVIITNPDNIFAAKKLGLTNYLYLPHPVNDKNIAKAIPTRSSDSQTRIFSPTRHNWSVKGNDLIIKGFNILIKRNPKINIRLFLCEWGQEVDKSKNLIQKLDLNKKVAWLKPMSKHELFKNYASCDIVMDQFMGYFGTTAPEAMFAKKPVIMWYDNELYKWAFKVAPPVILAKTPNDISKALETLLDAHTREKIGQDSFNWAKLYHSSELVTSNLIKIYGDIK